MESDAVLILRQVIALAMLSVASYFDIKYREVDDRIWIAGAISGIIPYFLSPVPSVMTFVYMGVGAAVGISWFVTRTFGQADGLALIALAIIFPSFDNIPVALVVSLGSIFILGISGTLYNVILNISDACNKKLFLGINESMMRKVVAFLTLHRKRRNEKFVISRQKNDKFLFRIKADPDEEFAGNCTGYVSTAFPLMPFMLAVLVVFLALF